MTQQIDTEQLRIDFDRDGYVLLPAFFSDEDLVDVRAMFDRFESELEDRENDDPTEYGKFETKPITFPLADEPAAQELITHPFLDKATQAVVGSAYSLTYAASWCTQKGAGQGWHQDSFNDDPGQFVLNRLIFVREIISDQGCLFVVPGSHRAGDIPPGENHGDLPGELAITAPAGSLALMHSRCYHRVGINQTDKPRIQMNSRALPANASEDTSYRAVFRTGRWDFRTNSEW
jgi:ectoine hydroxylase-related dioxygenase (phytanoyl-CoA dioxygenase family)